MIREFRNNIAESAPTLTDLKQLTVREQGLLLLKRLAKLFPRGKSFNKDNFTLSYRSEDALGLTSGYSGKEVPQVLSHLLGEPWHYIEQHYYITSRGYSNFEITEKGWAEVEKPIAVYVPDALILDSLRFLHSDLRDYGHYFREQKRKEAVAAAFRRVENRLNEIRDASKLLTNKGVSGTGLPYSLFDSGDLNFPFPELAARNQASRSAYLQALKSLLSSGIGWFRNSFDHEPHNLPDIDDAQAIELLFVASYMLRVIDAALVAPPSSAAVVPGSSQSPEISGGTSKSPIAPIRPRPSIAHENVLSLRAVLNSRRVPVPGGGTDEELYEVSAGIENDGDLDATDFRLDLEVPGSFLDGGGPQLLRVQSTKPNFVRYQITNSHEPCRTEHLYPGDRTRTDLLPVNLVVRPQVKQLADLLQEKVTATVFSGNMRPQRTEMTVAEISGRSPFHGGNTGSNPVGDAKKSKT